MKTNDFGFRSGWSAHKAIKAGMFSWIHRNHYRDGYPAGNIPYVRAAVPAPKKPSILSRLFK